MPLHPQDKEIIKKSLIYYFEALVKFSAEEELPKITKIDLLNECITIGKVRDEVGSLKQPAEDSYSYRLDNLEYNRVVCSALKCYLRDLEESTEKISGLYDDAKIPLSLTNTDLQLVNEALDKIPECERTADENE